MKAVKAYEREPICVAISSVHYSAEITVDGNPILLDLQSGWWVVTDGRGNNVLCPFRMKSKLGAIFKVIRHVLERGPKP